MRSEEARAAQRDLVRHGYPLPGSTRKDGELDGLIGPETVAAAKQYALERRLVPLRGRNALGLALDRGELPPALLGHLRRSPVYVRGIDVSRWQGAIDWPLVARAGVKFVYVKATQGASHVDPFFARHWRGAREAGLVVGAYHFWSQTTDPARQAAHFARTLGEYDAPLPPVLDVEGERIKGAEETSRKLSETLAAFDDAARARCAIYSSARIWREWNLSAGEDRLAWLVGWSVGQEGPRVEPFGDWWIWQTGYGAGLPGTRGDVDRNLMRPAAFAGLKAREK